MNPAHETGLLICYRAGGLESDRPPEKRKVGSSTLPLTTTTWEASHQPSHLRKAQKERDLHGAVSAVRAKIPTENPQSSRAGVTRPAATAVRPRRTGRSAFAAGTG